MATAITVAKSDDNEHKLIVEVSTLKDNRIQVTPCTKGRRITTAIITAEPDDPVIGESCYKAWQEIIDNASFEPYKEGMQALLDSISPERVMKVLKALRATANV